MQLGLKIMANLTISANAVIVILEVIYENDEIYGR
jgi:hypothetical protein